VIRSRPVIVAGRFLGAVVSQAEGWSFIATDPAVADLQGKRFPDPDEAARIAGLVLERSRVAPASPPVLRPMPMAPPGLRLVPTPEPNPET
jgi:hypothetical protein